MKTDEEVQSETVSPESDTEEVVQVEDTTVVFREEVPMAEEGHIGGDFWNSDQEWAATQIGQTKGGKTVQVVKRSEGMGYEVNFREGGEKPAQLDGWFTSYDKAEQAARTYLNSQ